LINVSTQAIVRVVRTKFSASAVEEAKKGNKEGGEKQVVPSLDDLPLGFNTGDKDIDRAATVLRLLYVNDMKELQSKINDLIVAVQNFTADPKVHPTRQSTSNRAKKLICSMLVG
jgi:RLL motif-containing protein 1